MLIQKGVWERLALMFFVEVFNLFFSISQIKINEFCYTVK